MDANFTRGDVVIAMQPVKADGRTFEPGDHFPYHRMGGVSERLVRQLIDQRKLGVLSQETYELAIARRQPGDTIPAGFTRDGLEHYGIDVVEPSAPPAEDPPTANDYDEILEVRGYKVGKRKLGAVTGYDVLADDGARINAGARLRGDKQLNAFLDTLPERAAPAQPSDNPEAAASEGGGDAADDGETAQEPAKEGEEGYGEP